MSERVPAVVLVDAAEPGNVGTAARAMRNFGFERLLLVDPPALDRDGPAYGFAGRAREDVLPAAEPVAFDAVATSYHTVGFTAVPNEDATSHVRFPYATPAELRGELAAVAADVALVFGRERSGLTNAELARLDRVCCIPASASYPALNLGQAVTVALYELRALAATEDQLTERATHRAAEADIERLYGQVEAYLAAINHPVEKREKVARLVRRLIGRAHPTDREVATLTGLLRRGTRYARPPEPAGDGDAESPGPGRAPR